jgi:hypothetical protein
MWAVVYKTIMHVLFKEYQRKHKGYSQYSANDQKPIVKADELFSKKKIFFNKIHVFDKLKCMRYSYPFEVGVSFIFGFETLHSFP